MVVLELSADYRMPVDVLRAELRRIVRQAKECDGRVCVLKITDVTNPCTTIARCAVPRSEAARSDEARRAYLHM